jgi:ATP-dependent Clp protease adaptor protein ClpS
VAYPIELTEEVLVEDDYDEPDQYRIILLNDDFTTMQFVVFILETVFHKDPVTAEIIMLDVHRKGKGIVGVYTWDIANTKKEQVHTLAEQNGFPLKCIMEKV